MADTAQPQPRLKHVQCLGSGGLHRMAYWEWGDAANPRVLVCVHGLSRQGRDFDTLARALLPHARVVAVDVAGRGHSDWLADPLAYQVPTYVADLAVLLQQLRAQRPGVRIDWRCQEGDRIGKGTVIATLQDLSSLYVDFNVPEQALPHLSLGQQVLLQVAAYPGQTFPASLSAINPKVEETTRNLLIRATMATARACSPASAQASRRGTRSSSCPVAATAVTRATVLMPEVYAHVPYGIPIARKYLCRRRGAG